MNFKLLFFGFILFSISLNAQTKSDNNAELNKLIETFRISIIEHNDFEKFSNLFLHDSITWAAIPTGETKKNLLKKRPGIAFLTSNYKSFFEGLEKGSEEKFYNVEIDVRDEFATISFDYSFIMNSKILNWGTEYWSLIIVNNEWKITSVTWSQNMQQIEACPF